MKRKKMWVLLFLLTVFHTRTPAAEEMEALKVDIPNAIQVGDHVLAGGQLDEDQLHRAAEAGFKTIVNLRSAGETGSLANEAELVHALNMSYVAIPIAGPGDLNETNARKLAKILGEPEALPAIVHCASGNRVGILFALKAFFVDGFDGKAALAFGDEAGARRVPASVHELLEVTPD
jgi:uncharacterized protein (TIGR01244 family)